MGFHLVRSGIEVMLDMNYIYSKFKYLKKTLPDNDSLVSNCRSEGMRDKKSLDPKIIEQYLNYRKTLKLKKN